MQPPVHRLLQLFEGAWFTDVIVHPGRQAPFAIAVHRVRRQGADGRVALAGFAGLNHGCRLKAIHDWHLAVHQNQIVFPLFHGLHSFAAIHYRVGGHAQLLKQSYRDALVNFVVFRQQNS